MQMKPPTFLSLETVADRLSVSVKTVRRLVSRGEIKIHRFGRQIRVSEDDFAIFSNSRRR